MTNFEKIKQMSVEEMAYFLNGFFSTCELCSYNRMKMGMDCAGSIKWGNSSYGYK